MSATRYLRMPGADAISRLSALEAGTDAERAHGEAEAILLRFLREIERGEVADAFEAARERVGFWYA